MDPYRDVIPDDAGIEVRKRVLERDGSDHESLPSKRLRASTDALLPLVLYESNLEAPPKPEDNLKSYDHDRLREGLRYIKTAEKRDITPRTREFFRLHKDAYKVALESTTPTIESLAVVQALDQVYYSAAFLLQPQDPSKHQHLMCMVKLRRLELLANYGDYLGQELQNIRARLKTAVSSGDPEAKHAAHSLGSSRTWLAISTELKGTDVQSLRKDVWVASDMLGIDSSHMEWLIKEWGERNETFHSQIRKHIMNCEWAKLAEQLCRDIQELLAITPDRATADRYEKVLLSIRDEYFEVINPDEASGWIPNATAVKLIKERMARQKKKERKT